jgi:cytochrome c-type biogenesis protein CcmE
MTLDAPAPRTRRWGVLLAVAVVAAAIGWLAFSGIGNALVYYKTPTELKAMGEAAIGQPLRVGGLVKSLHCRELGDVSFTMTDGHTVLQVVKADPNSRLICPRKGIGVVVEGRLGTLGVFEASQVIIKHDENYVAPSAGGLPTQVIDPGT